MLAHFEDMGMWNIRILPLLIYPGCPVSLKGSGRLDSYKFSNIIIQGITVESLTSRGLLLATINTSRPLERCHIADSQVFDIAGSAAAATAAIDYITGVPDGVWLAGISNSGLNPNADLLENIFLREVGIDTTLLNEDGSKIAFVVRKGDSSSSKAAIARKGGGPVAVVADLTERKDGKLEHRKITKQPLFATLIHCSKYLRDQIFKAIYLEIYLENSFQVVVLFS